MRRGGASAAFDAGIPGEMIKAIGDWRSDAYLRYLHVSQLQKFDMAVRLMRHVRTKTQNRA